MNKLISILVVCLNPGKKIITTLDSIKAQSFKNYEVIVKDGASSDGTLERLNNYEGLDISVISQKDSGIYDAMNQAVSYATGKYVYFLNCGDSLYDSEVLAKIAEADEDTDSLIIYGNIYEMKTSSHVCQNPVIDGFACYRNVPCHQACFYNTELVKAHPFDINYKVRADYEQFLWCYFKGGTRFKYIDTTVASYEGDGYSESKVGAKLSADEHKVITQKYMSSKDIRRYKTKLLITLAPLRRALAHNRLTAKMYNGIKNTVYGKKR